MPLRRQLLLALGALLAVMVLSIGLSGLLVARLVGDSRAILADNFRSISYVQAMQAAIDTAVLAWSRGADPAPPLARFDAAFAQQLANVTEPGEATLHEQIAAERRAVGEAMADADPGALARVTALRASLHSLSRVNEAAVEERNARAAASADDALLYSGLMSALALLLALALVWQLPRRITGTIDELSAGIGRIAGREFDYRVEEARADEFAPMARAINSLSDRLAAYERSSLAELVAERNRLAAVIAQFDQPILGLGADRRVLFANARMAEVLGVDADALAGMPLAHLSERTPLVSRLLADGAPAAATADGDAGGGPDDPAAAEVSDRSSVRVVVDGRERLFAARTIALRPVLPQGDLPESPPAPQAALPADRLLILQDVTDFVQRDARKTQFMATLSHELKTPVAAIEMCGDLMASARVGELNPEQRGYLAAINDNAERIRRMITEVLDLARIEAGGIDLHPEDVAPGALLEQALETVRPFVEERGLTVEREVAEGLPAVRVDAHKVVWALNNFLTNAIRYAPEGGRLVLKAKPSPRGDGLVRLAVRDFGRGIREADQHRIFEKYERLGRSERGGTGLGLAISKEFVEAMGGRIGVDSAYGAGAEFWVEVVASRPA